MSEENDIILEPGEEESAIIQDQIDVLVTLNEMDHSGLFDEWNELKIKAVLMAMKIIIRTQSKIFKDLK